MSFLAFDGCLGVAASAFLLNMLPFASPSNLLIAVNAALITPLTPLAIGLSVAAAASAAKIIHYYTAFFTRRVLSKDRKIRLDKYGVKMGRWGILAIFVIASTPIPDDPLIIPLGLMKYSPLKLGLGYFSGKFLIATVGAYLGSMGRMVAGPTMVTPILIISVLLTVAVTFVLIKLDVERLILGFKIKLGRLKKQ